MSSVEAKGELVADIPDYAIKPGDLGTNRHYWGAFGDIETETSAYWVVKLSQKLSGWVPFTLTQVEGLYNEGGHRDFGFNRLVKPEVVRDLGREPRLEGGGFVVERDGLYFVTTTFVERIHQALKPTDPKPQPA